MEIDEYKTLSSNAETELKIKGSRFIGQIYPVETVAGAEEIIERCRRQYRDATHCCFAYRLGIDGSITRFSDDGEPSGTAGKPLLSILEHNNVTNVLLMVIRYFGGTKLGTGGLVRAYTDTAQEAFYKTSVISVPVLKDLRITFPYDYTNGVMHVISRFDLKINDTEYGEDVTIYLGVQPSMIETVGDQLRNITSGNIAVKQ